MKKKPDELDLAFKKVMGDLLSGKLYRKYLRDMKKSGLDVNKPLTLTFKDGHTETTAPVKDMMPHLNPKNIV